MTKWMRKYRKWLWGFGGSLLMVTFLLTGPQSIFQPNPGKRVVATMGGAKVRADDQQHSDLELEALKNFIAPLVGQMGIENGAHWMLLSREAEEAGLVGAEGDGQAWVPELGKLMAFLQARRDVVGRFGQFGEQLLRAGYLDNQIQQQAAAITDQATAQLEQYKPRAAAHARLTVEQMDRALAKLHGVLRLQDQYAKAARVSDRRALAEVKRLLDKVLVDAVIIPASKAQEGIPEPAESEIAGQYLKYQSTKPGTGEYGFGYLQPARVKFEWMVLDREAMMNAITLDEVEVNKYWRLNKAKYKGEFEADKAQVEKDLKGSRVDALLADADRYYKTALRNATRPLQQDGAVKKLPADWETKRPTMATLAAEVDKALKQGNAGLPAPAVDARASEWVKIDKVGEVPGIGSSRFQIGTRQGTLADLLKDLHELSPNATTGLQNKVPFETPLRDGKQNVYYFNVLDFRGESAPETMEEVRADVVKDLKVLAAFERLRTEQALYQLQAVTEGLDAVAKRFTTPAEPGAADQTPKPLPVMKLASVRREVADPGLNEAPIREAVTGAADALGQQFVATADNAAQRTLSVPVPSTLSLVVIQIVGQEPATVETMRLQDKRQFDMVAQNELMKLQAAAPFSFESMKKRFDYKPVQEEKKSSGEPVELPY
jgi:hypothetical protein